ncbi:MAG TPA: hypothetical protein VNL77_22505 [Roseiflexaceae bacterium]|nr:hypothetical protein [Roseiflexaceae bacterium]
MFRPRISAALLIAVCLALLGAGAVGAAPGKPRPNSQGKGPKARITWSLPRVDRTLSPGESATVEVAITSSADVDNLQLWIPGGLGRMTTMAGAPTSLKAGQPVTFTLTFTMPATGALSQGGVVKVRAGRRNLPANLPVLLTVRGAPVSGAGK